MVWFSPYKVIYYDIIPKLTHTLIHNTHIHTHVLNENNIEKSQKCFKPGNRLGMKLTAGETMQPYLSVSCKNPLHSTSIPIAAINHNLSLSHTHKCVHTHTSRAKANILLPVH